MGGEFLCTEKSLQERDALARMRHLDASPGLGSWCGSLIRAGSGVCVAFFKSGPRIVLRKAPWELVALVLGAPLGVVVCFSSTLTEQAEPEPMSASFSRTC